MKYIDLSLRSFGFRMTNTSVDDLQKLDGLIDAAFAGKTLKRLKKEILPQTVDDIVDINIRFVNNMFCYLQRTRFV
jgi:hypothetical protein